MKHTKEQLLVAGLVAKGHHELPSASRYRKFTAKAPDRFFFVGPNGALRYGRTASESRSLEGWSQLSEILDLGQRQLNGLGLKAIDDITTQAINRSQS
jgi:hypothetical protein